MARAGTLGYDSEDSFIDDSEVLDHTSKQPSDSSQVHQSSHSGADEEESVEQRFKIIKGGAHRTATYFASRNDAK